jgi:hypothetical protein
LANFFIHAGFPVAGPFCALTFCFALPWTFPPFFFGMLKKYRCDVYFVVWLECPLEVWQTLKAAMERTKANATNEMRSARSNRCTGDAALGNARCWKKALLW